MDKSEDLRILETCFMTPFLCDHKIYAYFHGPRKKKKEKKTERNIKAEILESLCYLIFTLIYALYYQKKIIL